jgi:hypothetical protein
MNMCTGLTIGFELTSLSVRENDTVAVCIKILQPADPNATIENRQYIVAFNVAFMPGSNSKLLQFDLYTMHY